MTNRERVRASLAHRQPDRVPIDFGGTSVTGIHVSCVAALREHYGLERRPVKAYEPYQMLGWIDEDLKRAMGIDVEGVAGARTMFGYANDGWKPWRMYDGLEVLVGSGFEITVDSCGDTLIYPEGDRTTAPSGRMPKGGYFFDTIVRQEPLATDPPELAGNLEEFGPVSDADLAHFDRETARAAATGRAVIASLGGTAFGDIALVPGPFLKHPKGIRDVAEWYMSTTSRRDHIHKIFSSQCEFALANLARVHAVAGDRIDAVFVCGADFGTQTSAFCSVATFRDLYFPYYKAVNDWIHRHTSWKTFKHSCGSVERFLPSMIECGFDILNPVQCSAANMGPAHLKEVFGGKLVFWGGGVDTQRTLPFGTPAEVRQQVLERCEIFSRGGGFVFNAIHNIQARTPVENIVAMIDAVHEFNGSPCA
jgi:hypothetical protein